MSSPLDGSRGDVPPGRWQRVRELFLAVVDLPAAEQQRYLDRADDPAVRAEVEAMLRYDRTGDGLRSAIGAAAVSLQVPEAEPGQSIGPYRLMRELGRGGMGTVWLAVRADDAYRQEVAIKLLRAAGDEQRRARFQAERQILATLEHPNIARLLDGGTTDDGVPYVVMEHVHGLPIDVYCASRRLTLEARLELFCQVCSALQYSHRHLVVHRDVKPTNILVNAEGVPKLLDFGIAKLLDSSLMLADPVPDTIPGSQLLTLEYASPEQVRGFPVTTAADVYALGVLLYELLVGRVPYRVATRDPIALARAICEQEPLRPSAAVAVTAPDAAADRPDEDARLGRRLAGDLDNVVMKALRKEPAERYGSAGELAQDLRRYLARQPVTATPDTWRYRIRKLASQYRWWLAGASAIALVLVVATVFSIAQMRLAVRASRVAQLERSVAVTQAQRAILAEAAARLELEDPVAARRLLQSVSEAARGWEWRHLLSETDRALAVVATPGALAVGLAAGGEEIVTVSRAGALTWRNAIRSEVTATAGLETDGIRYASFSTDGERLAVADGPAGERVSVWALRHDGEPTLLRRERLEAPVSHLALAGSGSGLIVTAGQDAWFWRSGNARPVRRRGDRAPRAVAISADGRVAAVVTEEENGSYRLLDPGDRAVPGFTLGRDVIGLALSPDGSVVANSDPDRIVRLRDAASARVRGRFVRQTMPPDVMTFSPDGRWLASSAPDGAVHVWDVASASARDVFAGPAGIGELRFAGNGMRLLAFTRDGEAWIWSVSEDAFDDVPVEGRGQAVAYVSDGSHALTLAADGGLWSLDHATGEPFDLVHLVEPSPAALAVSPDGRTIVTAHGGGVIVREAMRPTRGAALDAGSSDVVAVAFAPDGGRLVTLSAGGTAVVWDPSERTTVARMPGAPAPHGDVAFAPDGSCVATAHRDGVRVWDPVTGTLRYTIVVENLEAGAVAYRPGGNELATGWADGGVRLVDPATGDIRGVLSPHRVLVQALAYAPDGQRLASGAADGSLWISDVATASPVLELRGHARAVVSLGYAPDGTTLLSGDLGSRVGVWDTRPFRERVRAADRLRREREMLRPLVAELLERTPDPEVVAASLRADPALAGTRRTAVLQIALDPPLPPSGVERDPFDGYAFASDALDSYVLVGAAEILRMTETFTIEAWIQPQPAPGAPRDVGMIVNREGEYEIAVFPDGEVAWLVAGPNGWGGPWERTRFRVPPRTWTHVALVRDGPTVRFHVNGRLVQTVRGPERLGDHHPTMNELRIGGRQHTPSSFRGRIDEVRIWGVARDEEQIRRSMLRHVRGDEPGLLAAWSFDEGQGRLAADARGRHAATLVGGRWSRTSR